jgi:hypothetical protein
MKKLYTSFLLLIAALSYGQSVVITTVADGTLYMAGCNATSGQNIHPRFVELYVSGTVNLFGYRLELDPNGTADNGTWSNNYVFLSGTYTDEFVYIVNIPYIQGQPTPTQVDIFLEMYPNLNTDNIIFSSYGPNFNGNDAVRIAQYQGTGQNATLIGVIDQFGNPNDVASSNSYNFAWAFADGYAKRINGTPANGGNFVNSTFTYSGNDALDNLDCTAFKAAVNIGTYNTTASAKDFDTIAGLKMYPNPLSGKTSYISSDTGMEKTVSVYDVLGKQVLRGKTNNETFNVAALTAGVYIVKITEAGKTATRKLIVK